MKKRAVSPIILLLAAMLLGLGGCGDDEEKEKEAESNRVRAEKAEDSLLQTTRALKAAVAEREATEQRTRVSLANAGTSPQLKP